MQYDEHGEVGPSGVEQITVEVLPDGRMNRATAARYIGCAAQTMAIWAVKGIGPPPIRIGGRVYYKKRDVDAFIAAGGA